MVLFSTLLRFIVIVDTSNRNGTEDRVTTPPPQASAICHHLQLEAWRLPSLPSHAQPHARLRCTGTHLCLILLSLSSCLQSTGVLLKKSLGRGPLSHLQTGKINGNSGEYLTRSQGLEFSSRLSMSSFRLESDKIHTLPRACPLSLSFKKKVQCMQVKFTFSEICSEATELWLVLGHEQGILWDRDTCPGSSH